MDVVTLPGTYVDLAGRLLLAIVALLFGQGDTSAPGRVLQGVLAGVGFIGAGVIRHRWRTASTAIVLPMRS